MNLSAFILGCLLLVVGSAICLYFAKLLLSSLSFLSPLFLKTKVFSPIRKAERHLKKADFFIHARDFKNAGTALKKSLLLEIKNENLLSQVKAHHQNLLNRCLVLVEEKELSSPHISDLEKFFSNWTELQVLALKSKLAFVQARRKRKEQKKNLPEWSLKEFKQREQEIRRECALVAREIEQTLDRLFEELKAKSEEIVYH